MNKITAQCMSFGGKIAAAVSLAMLLVSAAQAQSDEYKKAFEAYQNQDFVAAESIWTDIANSGDVNAQYALGVMQLRDEGVDSSEEKAFAWFSKAAQQGHATAMFNVGVAYWEGTGVETDRQTALNWWEKAARDGDSGAQFNLGLAYYIGEERDTNMEVAAKWIGLAADQNHPEAKRIMQVIAEENPELALANTRKKLDKTDTKASGASANVKTVSQDVEAKTASDTAKESQTTASVSSTTTEPATQTPDVEQPKPAPAKAPVEKKDPRYWKTTALNTPLYAKPGNDSIIFSSLPNGTPVDVIDKKADWVRITLPDGLKTWVFSKFVTVQNSNGTINATGVRARPQPSTDNSNSPPIGAYNRGDKVKILEKSGQWYRIRAPKHIGAWVRADDLEAYEDTPAGREQLWKLMVSKGL